MNDLFQTFQEFRRILCVCPCCGDLVRVSDLRLSTKGGAAQTWLDKYEKKELKMTKSEAYFDEREEDLRERSVERGRKAAEKSINKAIMPQLRALKLDPFDLKPILHPIDFVVFKGMNKKEKISDIMLLSKWTSNPHLISSRSQIQQAVEGKRYEWQLARIDEKGHLEFE